MDAQSWLGLTTWKISDILAIWPVATLLKESIFTWFATKNFHSIQLFTLSIQYHRWKFHHMLPRKTYISGPLGDTKCCQSYSLRMPPPRFTKIGIGSNKWIHFNANQHSHCQYYFLPIYWTICSKINFKQESKSNKTYLTQRSCFENASTNKLKIATSMKYIYLWSTYR